jgi:hypothetical protein
LGPDQARAREALPEVVCIVGMHRSGTSCLAGCLEEAGLELGDVVTEAPHNLKGNRESLTIRGLHEELLQESGGSWDRPPVRVRWQARHRAQRDEIIASHRGRPIWGFKDPRTLLTIDGWLEALPGMRLVGSYRHPLAVGRSLARRDGMSLDEGVRLWTHYNRILLDLHLQRGCALIRFDLPAADYLAGVTRLARSYRLEVPAAGLRFFDEALRRQGAEPAQPLPPETVALWARLQRLGGGR